MLPTRRRIAITATEKLAVLDAWVQCGNITAVIKAFYSGLDEFAQEQRRKLIYQWRQKRKGIELACKTARGRAKKKARPSGTGTALPAEKLVVWISELRGSSLCDELLEYHSVPLHLSSFAKVSRDLSILLMKGIDWP
ncbi:hypothetical protein PI124_g18201 [Phytophthora idaei]|nr:hypothetical protein PI125_g18860 [Phytophthora idaei]KAG3137002.1 hypothetical protein PI126_g17573 [Phytophthora idaei]KAG3236794.1 hypothetical protein PI124_g18201 [Phytophthora idaei]